VKRHIVKDIVLALLPLSLFLAYAFPAYSLKIYNAYSFNYVPFALFLLVAPIIVGAVLCVALIYAWKNRASTVFISLFCGAFLVNGFFTLCQLGVFNAFRSMHWQMVLRGGVEGVDLAGVMDGTYIVMFWISLVSFIKARRQKKLTEVIE